MFVLKFEGFGIWILHVLGFCGIEAFQGVEGSQFGVSVW